MAKIFKLAEPNTNLRKNVFDLSRKIQFTHSCGQILPTAFIECNPGEKFRIKIHAHTRTQELNTAATTQINQYHHVHFIPYRQLWNGFQNFITGVNNKTSAIQGKFKIPKEVPYIDIFKVVAYFLEVGFKSGSYGGSLRPISIDTDIDALNAPPLNSKEFTSIEDLGKILRQNELGYPLIPAISKFLELIGCNFSIPHKGTYYSVSFVDLFHHVFNTLVQEGSPTPTNGAVVGRVLSFLKAGSYNVSIFRILAYNKVYNDFYRRDDIEESRPFEFNVDDYYKGGDITDDFISSRGYDSLARMFSLRYRNLPKDYFTGAVPSELLTRADEEDFVISDETFKVSDKKDSIEIKINEQDYITTKAIRTAYAIEKMLRLSRRAQSQSYTDQILAHFGFKPRGLEDDKVRFVGGNNLTVNISEVLSTSNSVSQDGNFGSYLGQIGAKGEGYAQTGEIDFEAQEHGIIMIVTSTLADLDYNAGGVDSFLTKIDRGSYFMPEFQDLGLQPLFLQELAYNPFYGKSPSSISSLYLTEGNQYVSSLGITSGNPQNALIGYVPRYAEYKTSYDRVVGILRKGKELSAFTATNIIATSNNGIDVRSLKMQPSSLDSIFAVRYNGLEETDQFITNQIIEVKAIRPMSVTGQNL